MRKKLPPEPMNEATTTTFTLDTEFIKNFLGLVSLHNSVPKKEGREWEDVKIGRAHV